MKTIKIHSTFTSEERMTRIGGEKLRHMIISSENGITLDCQNRAIASVSFWDEAIAKLKLEKWTLDDIKTKITFKATLARDKEVIQALLKERFKQK